MKVKYKAIQGNKVFGTLIPETKTEKEFVKAMPESSAWKKFRGAVTFHSVLREQVLSVLSLQNEF